MNSFQAASAAPPLSFKVPSIKVIGFGPSSPLSARPWKASAAPAADTAQAAAPADPTVPAKAPAKPAAAPVGSAEPAEPAESSVESSAEPRSVNPAHLATLLFLGAVWGAAFLFLRVAGSEVGPVWAAEIRIAIGAAVLVAIFGRRTWAAARPRLGTFLIAGAAFSAIPFSLIAIAVQTLPVGLGAILNASTPLFTAMVGIVWLGDRLSMRMVVGLLTGVAAVTFLVGWSPLELDLATGVAVLAALGAALSYAFAGTFVRRRLPGVGGTEVATGQLVAGALLLLPFAIASGAPGTPTPTGLLALLAVGTVSTALPWPIFFRLLKTTTPTIASSVTFVVPAFAVTWGAMALGEPVGPELIGGFAMIIVSLVLVLGLGPDIGPRVGPTFGSGPRWHIRPRREPGLRPRPGLVRRQASIHTIVLRQMI